MSGKRFVSPVAIRSSSRRWHADDNPQMTPPSQRSRTSARPRSMLEVAELGDEAVPFLKENAVKGAECVGAQDPLLVLDWNDAALGTQSLLVPVTSVCAFFLTPDSGFRLHSCRCGYCAQRCVHQSGHPGDLSTPSATSAEPHESGGRIPVSVP